MATYELDPRGGPVSGWALGGIVFAAAIMLLIGIYQILAGLAAIINDDFFVVSDDYIYDLDATGWGWIHLIVGIIVVAGGVGLFYAVIVLVIWAIPRPAARVVVSRRGGGGRAAPHPPGPPQPRALALSRSNSSCEMVPSSRSFFAFAI